MHVGSVALPVGPDGKRLFDETRGTKKDKMDLEAAVVGDHGELILFGSGSSGKRERIALVAMDRPVKIFQAGMEPCVGCWCF